MAVRYLLVCPCGESVAVEASQAGGEMRCPVCRELVDVPTLRKLRQLPQAEPPAVAAQGRDWTGRHSLAAVALIVAVIATVVASYMWMQEQSDSGIRGAAEVETEQLIEQLTPAETWNYWQDFQAKVEAYGFDAVRSYARLQRQFVSARYAWLKKIWLIVAVAAVLVTIVTWFWPARTPRPHTR